MNVIAKINSYLAKLVGPNAAHMIDAGIGVAIVGAAAYASSAPARQFLNAHATLSVIVTAAIPVATALASKFRNAAGSNADLVDEIVKALGGTIAKTKPPAAK